MWWVVTILAVVVILALFEWRSRNKPLAAGLKDHWAVHSAPLNGGERPMTGGHNTDDRQQ